MDHDRHAGAIITFAAMACGVSSALAAPLQQDVNTVLNLRQSDVQVIDVLGGDGDHLHFSVLLRGEVASVSLERWSIRTPDYQIFETDPAGRLVPRAAGPVNTWRGTVAGHPESLVIASFLEGSLRAGIRLDAETLWWIEAIDGRVAGAVPGDHAVYADTAIISPDGWCGTDVGAHTIGTTTQQQTGATRGLSICSTEMACDADYEYFQDYGSVEAVEERINAVIATVNLQYESQVDISHVIGTIVVRSYENDPYSGNSMEQRLYQFRNYWNANYDNIQRDLAELFTGASDSGSTIGIAWVGVVCTNYAYSVVESDCCGSFGCATDLTAHELGHNWGSGHCDCSNNTMNPYITCSNTFSNSSIASIVSFRNSIDGCLDCGPPAPTGACCLGEVCSVDTYESCASLGGTWLGESTECSASACLPSGACCVGDACSVGSESDCAGLAGTWLGEGTNCSGQPCNTTPVGGCCTGVTCQESTEAECGGTWLGAGTNCLGFPCNSSGLNGIGYAIVGQDLVPDIGENWTVDVFALVGAGSRIDAVAGNSVQQKTIVSTGGFWQSPLGGPTSQAVNPAFYELEPTLEWDSRVTIGALDSSGAPFPENALGDIGIAWSDFESGGAVSAGDGTWYVLPIYEQGGSQPFLSQDCQTAQGVLIARLTVLGYGSEVLVEALFQGRDVDNETWQDTASQTIVHSSVMDCNDNGVADHCDIAGGGSADENGNGIPDECESACMWDIDGDGDTDIDDILTVISGFGSPYTVDDLLGLLGEFGCGGG